jgi:hypothetical protein
LNLPPIDNHARKIIHELANKLKLKSKSQGKGNGRSPVLYRTLGTLKYSESSFEEATYRVRRKYFPRTVRNRGRSPRGNKLPSGQAAATFQDGEIVGAGAAELGVENKGRVLLEKMGWSSGTALGARNNKGIMLPVVQVVKRSKAGLG